MDTELILLLCKETETAESGTLRSGEPGAFLKNIFLSFSSFEETQNPLKDFHLLSTSTVSKCPPQELEEVSAEKIIRDALFN